MALDRLATSPQSRRALLASALGAAAALGAQALGRPAPVRANDPNDVVLGSYFNDETTTTKIRNSMNTATAFWGSNEAGGIGVFGTGSAGGHGVAGSTATGDGVNGYSASGRGVFGNSGSGVGVSGNSTSSDGVVGSSASGGHSGVWGHSTAGGYGVSGSTSGSAAAGVWGSNSGTGTGVRGTAVSGRGIHGKSSSGYAGYFEGKVFSTKFYELKEISNPVAPSANRARLFARDNGSGLTQLCVRFSNGAVRVLATM
jgi:hypothetical protein